MKALLYGLLAVICLAFSSCNENKVVEEDPGDRNLGATVQQMLKEENIDQAIWNPEGMDVQNWPVIEVKNEEELRQLLRDFHQNAEKMSETIRHINQVNQNRNEAFHQELSYVNNRRDSLSIAMKYPDIITIRDTLELIDLGLVTRK